MLPKLGPVKARFATKLTLSNLDPPASYTIAGEGVGGKTRHAPEVQRVVQFFDRQNQLRRKSLLVVLKDFRHESRT